MKTIHDFKKYKEDNIPFTVLTAYDFHTARFVRDSDVDCVLVGDSVAQVVYGYPSTVHATVEMMARHTAIVRRVVSNKFIVVDMPFLSFRKSLDLALETVDQLVKAGADAVKIEGVEGHEKVIEHIVQSGVPVMAHLGLTPQSVLGFGGMRVQGKTNQEQQKIIADAKKCEELGCFSLVLECVPRHLASQITKQLSIPTIGIGAGIETSGQVLVIYDLLGFDQSFQPKFVKRFLNTEKDSIKAINQFCLEVKTKQYPSVEESY